jgi:peptidyl-Lys metalloendopeptidase
MLSSFLHAFLVAFAFAVAVSAAPGLTVKTSIPNDNVYGLENLWITTIIVNTGNRTLKLLNDPRGVLDPFPENSFRITNAAGSHPLFNGDMVNHPSVYLINTCAHPFGFRF